MTESLSPKDVTAYNEQLLKSLVRAITLSQGDFSLILVHCNYTSWQPFILQQLRQQCPVEIRKLVLNHSIETLYSTIQAELRDKQPQALMIFGLELVSAVDQVLTVTNQVREEFRNKFSFPLLLWINDEVLKKLIRLAPDFASWAAPPIRFEVTTSVLIDFLQQKADLLFNTDLVAGSGRYAPWRVCTHHSTLNLATGCRSRLELDSALRDLQSRQHIINPQLEASLEFVFGQYDYASDFIDSAFAHYQQSLSYWRAS